MGRPRLDLDDAIVRFIEWFIAGNGYSPTVEEIRVGIKCSSKCLVQPRLKNLIEAGVLAGDAKKARSVRPARPAAAAFRVPVVGTIAAGEPIRLFDQRLEEIALTSHIASAELELFALRVKGQSMIDAGIFDGDLLVAAPCPDVPNGQMAVVHLRDQNEATLKKVYREGDRVRLQPANSAMDEFYADADNVEIQGRVVAVVRTM